MTNSSSAYLGIAAGAAIGGYIIDRSRLHVRKMISCNELRSLERGLAHLDAFAKHHDNILNKIFILNEKILALDKNIE